MAKWNYLQRMIKKNFPILFEPFPENVGLGDAIKSSLIIGVIIFLILGLLRPFGLWSMPHPFIDAAKFGLISMVVSFLVELVWLYIIPIDRERTSWVFWKWLVSVMITITMIAAANFVYLIWAYGASFSVGQALYTWFVTIIIGIVPTIIFGALGIIRSLRYHQDIAKGVGHHEEPISEEMLTFNSNNQSDEPITIRAAQFLYAEALQNYVRVHWQTDSGLTSKLIRSTLSQLESESPSFVARCHRSFLVNKDQIQSAEGNAQGLQLSVGHTAQVVVPVSRKYVLQFR